MTTFCTDTDLIDTNESCAKSTNETASFAIRSVRDSGDWRDAIIPQTERTTSTSSLKLTQFASLIRHYLTTPGSAKHDARTLVIDDLCGNLNIVERIDLLLTESVNSTLAGRLDDAIDVLSDERVDLASYLCDVRTKANLEFLNFNEIHVLIRAAGGHVAAAGFIYQWALRSKHAAVRVSAVEAIADIGTDSAINSLHDIEENDQEFQSVREVAREYLAELREE